MEPKGIRFTQIKKGEKLYIVDELRGEMLTITVDKTEVGYRPDSGLSDSIIWYGGNNDKYVTMRKGIYLFRNKKKAIKLMDKIVDKILEKEQNRRKI